MKNKLKILYHFPSLESIYAGRTLYNGYKNAFTDLGHEFFTLTSNDNLKETLERIRPDIFITSSHNYHLKFLDLNLLEPYRKKGMIMFTWISFWNSPLEKSRINEAKSLKDEKDKIEMIKNGLLGDIFFIQLEQEDKRMEGFKEETGKDFVTIPLAADKTLIFNEYDKKFEGDISYIGTNLPQKRKFFKEQLFPLGKKYELKLYGQDWTSKDKLLGWIQKFGQYFNINFLKKVQSPKLDLNDERKIYSSSKICVNIHEDYQKEFGGDFNERTYKIPLCKGFEITDDVASIRKYFEDGKEIVIAKDKEDWFKKIDYYMNHPEERKKIAEAGYKKVLKSHTYNNRAEQFIALYNKVKEKR